MFKSDTTKQKICRYFCGKPIWKHIQTNETGVLEKKRNDSV